jgi:hypothetical protein
MQLKHTLYGAGLVMCSTVMLAQGPPSPPFAGRQGGPGRGSVMMGLNLSSGTPVTGAPFSAVESTTAQHTLANGNQITRHDQSTVYRDSQGRLRIEQTVTLSSGSTAKMFITLVDPVAGFSYRLDPSTMTAVQNPLRQTPNASVPGGGQGRAAPGATTRKPQLQRTDLGTQVVNGLVVTGTRTTETIPAGAIGNQQEIQIIRDVWVSADLRIQVLLQSNDPRGGTIETQLVNIIQGNQDPTLFQVPAGYTITTRPGRPGVPASRG